MEAPVPLELLIGADDRTGALEAAGAAAAVSGRRVRVVVADAGTSVSHPIDGGAPGPGGVVVVDIASRHLGRIAAGERASALDLIESRRHVHKIDSTLRGRWATELVARSARGRPVVVVPALPALGRTCVGGVVMVDGTPVAETDSALDVIAPPASSRPAALLSAAGAGAVHELRSPEVVRAWMEHPDGIAVVDAATDDEIASVAAVCEGHPEVLLAGTSALAAAVARTMIATSASASASTSTSASASTSTSAPSPRRPTARPDGVLVVVGSGHPVVVEQVDRLRRRGAVLVSPDDPVTTVADGPVVIAAERPPDALTIADAHRHARAVGAVTARWIETMAPEIVVVIGGDTTASVLGDEPLEVAGLIAPGTPWLERDGRVIVTRAGGFGGPDALADLVWGTLIE